jgi:phosphatidylglycerophosphate synthase
MLDDGRGRRWLPWSLSLLRLVLGPFYVLALEMSAVLPLAVAVVAAASDFVDGRLARRLGATSRAGAVLDVLADGVFVVIALASLASLGVVTRALPVAVVLALVGLALASLRAARTPDAGSPPRARGPADRAGHAAGIVNYGAVLAGSAAVAGWIDGGWIVPASVAVAVLNVSPLALRLAHGARRAG